MSALLKNYNSSHVVDILGNTKGRDQPVTVMNRAIQLVNLLPEEKLVSNDYVIFDPFCKAGEILLSSAYNRCSFLNNNSLLDTEEISNEMFTSNRYYGLAPDERHYRLSLRTFLGNKKSHNNKYTNIIKNGNYLSEKDGKLDKKKFKKELEAMINYIKKTSPNKKIIAVGNPPYQESDGGAKASAKPIYNYFVEQLMNSGEIDSFALVIPARWFSGGKGLDKFRKRMIESNQIKKLQYFERAEDVFPTVHVQGGICFINWERSFNGKTEFSDNINKTTIDLSRFDIIPDDPKAGPIIEKVLKNNTTKKYINSTAWARKPFGLATDYFKKNKEDNKTSSKSIKCFTKSRTIKYINKEKVKKNSNHIERWKVVIPCAYATGAKRCTLPKHQIFLLKPNEISTETYSVINTFKTKKEAEKLIKYLQTDFARYLLGLRKLTQHIPSDRWSWVPDIDLNKDWTDEKLYKFFKLTKAEQEHIKRKVESWT